MTNLESISALLSLLRERQTFVVSSHARPDGDAIGSSLALMHLLEVMGKDVVVAFSDPIPPQFHCLAGVERIVHELPSTSPDALVLLECDRPERTGFPTADFDRLGHRLRFNLRVLGRRWFERENLANILDVVIHEASHARVSDHMSADYYRETTRIGGLIAALALTKPEVFPEGLREQAA